MENFPSFLDLFQKDSVKVDVCQKVMDAFCRYQIGGSNDISLAGTILNLGKSWHDSLNSLSLDDERRQAAQIICQSLEKFHFGKDYEQQLQFFVDARGNFSNLDPVMGFLVTKVNQLAIETKRQMGGRHSRKSAGFVRACVAYSYITVPRTVEIQKITKSFYRNSYSFGG